MLIRLFQGRFVEFIDNATAAVLRESTAIATVGSVDYDTHRCWVIAAVGRQDPPKGIWRLWIETEHFVVLRMEHVEVTRSGELATASAETVHSLVEVAPGIWLPTEARVDQMGRIDGQFVWQWTKRFQLHDVRVNEQLQLTPADYLFSPSFRWRDQTTKQDTWDGGRELANQADHAVEAKCDAALLEIADHAADLEAWMLRPAE